MTQWTKDAGGAGEFLLFPFGLELPPSLMNDQGRVVKLGKDWSKQQLPGSYFCECHLRPRSHCSRPRPQPNSAPATHSAPPWPIPPHPA